MSQKEQILNLLPAQATKILEILQDGENHCPIEWKYADGHGKRFTDINRYLGQFGKKLESEWCDCGRHNSRIKMRRITPIYPEAVPIYPNTLQSPTTGQIAGNKEAVVAKQEHLFSFTGQLRDI